MCRRLRKNAYYYPFMIRLQSYFYSFTILRWMEVGNIVLRKGADLPGTVGVLVVSKVVFDPVVNVGERHFPL